VWVIFHRFLFVVIELFANELLDYSFIVIQLTGLGQPKSSTNRQGKSDSLFTQADHTLLNSPYQPVNQSLHLHL
jgi:hypothetical protein